MKSLIDFIKESNEENKSFTFIFKNLENGKETLDSLKNIDYVTVTDDEEKASVLVNADNADKFDTFQDIMQQYVSKLDSSTKKASDEQYAQKIKSFKNKFNEFVDYIDQLLNSDDEEQNKEEE